MVGLAPEHSQKRSGAYFTPGDVSAALVAWACRKPSDRMIDPSCGDGQFVALPRNSDGIEQNPVSAHRAIERAPGADLLAPLRASIPGEEDPVSVILGD